MADQVYVQELMDKARAAQAIFANATQEQLNLAARACAKVVFDNAEMFAREAVEETGMGTIPGKVAKQMNSMRYQWMYTKSRPSTGIIGWEKGKLDVDCILTFAKPAGILCGVMPTTNPTTNIGSNTMQALKCGNAIIICPHPRAKKVSKHCCDLIRAAVAETGAPIDLIQCVEEPTMDLTQAIMKAVDLVLVTGGTGVVKAGNESGNPSLGCGQGNVQVVIDKNMSYDFDRIATLIANNRAYDSGIPCTCEQTVFVPAADKEAFIAALNRNNGMYVDDKDIIQKFRETIFNIDPITGVATPNPKKVGNNIQSLGKECGLDVPDNVVAVALEVTKYGTDELLCREKMLPVVSLFAYEGEWEDAIAMAKTNLLMEGAGHSSSIYTDDREHQIWAGYELPVGRVCVNGGQGLAGGRPYYCGGMPATSGTGCGYWQKNAISDNLTFERMLNYTRVLYRVPAEVEDPTDEEIWAINS